MDHLSFRGNFGLVPKPTKLQINDNFSIFLYKIKHQNWSILGKINSLIWSFQVSLFLFVRFQFALLLVFAWMMINYDRFYKSTLNMKLNFQLFALIIKTEGGGGHS